MLKNSLLVLVSVVIAIVLFDGGFRLYEKYFPARVLETDGPVVDLPSMSYNNDTPVSKAKPLNEHRLLSFGDSFAFSITKYPYSYHAVAADRLNAASLGEQVRIVNVGEPGVSFYQYIKGYRFWSEVFEHDGAIFNIYMGNDILDVTYNWVPRDAELHRRFSKAKINFATGRPMKSWIPRRYPLRFLDHFHATWLQKTGRVKVYKPKVNDDRYNLAYVINDEERLLSYNKKQLENFDYTFVEKLAEGYKGFVALVHTASAARKQGKHMIFMLAPNATQIETRMRDALKAKYQIDLSPYDFGLPSYILSEIIRRIDDDIPVVNLVDVFQCGEASGLALYPNNNTHWSVAGNRLAGEELAHALSRSWLKNKLSALSKVHGCVGANPLAVVSDDVLRKRTAAFDSFIQPLLSVGNN